MHNLKKQTNMSNPNRSEDNYIPCDQYATANADDKGFCRFSKDDQYYFSYVENDKVILRSEGYDAEKSRENGIASVLKNMTDDANFKTKQLENGKWVLSLKAANHQEIAQTCEVDTETDANAYLPSVRAKMHASKASADSNIVTDDYMICREYEEKIKEVSEKYPDFISFQHEQTELYYFAWINKRNEIVLRSEGYTTPAARDNGIESVMKNREIEERFKTEEHHGAHFLILKAGNHQEIGRSCPKNTEAELWALLKDDSSNAKAKSENVADDYMICREYEEQISKVSPKYPDFIVFQHEHTKLHYFAWINKDKEIVLRSEGYPTTAARDNGLESVRKNREIKERFKTEEHHGAHFLILKAGNNQEIGRSCPNTSAAALWGLLGAGLVAGGAATAIASTAKVPVAPVVATAPLASAATAVASGKSGFNWWWLLPLLLLIPLLLWWKSCNSKTEVVEVPVETPAAEMVPVDTAKKEEVATAVPAPAEVTSPKVDCSLNWILFDFDKYSLRNSAKTELKNMAGILKENQDFVGELNAYTDSRGSDEYNQVLSENRATSAKTYLVDLGIDGSRIKINAASKTAPVAKNTDDDSGRKFNRRVELYIKDKAGNEICKSTPPAVPANLKTN